jgi:dephospho-CoA kinase
VTLVIGMTGPIGCGKSTVASWLGELGATVINADQVAREVTGPGSAALAAIVAAFGPDLIRADGSLDRSALGRIVFNDAEALARLEAIVHPAVRPVILERIATATAGDARVVVIEAIKLVEGGLAALCDELWLVTCDAGDQLARLLGRGANRADAEARIAAQSGVVERLTPFATRVIDTTGSVDETRRLVDVAWSESIAARPS